MKHNPFKADVQTGAAQKEHAKDPLDVKDLLIDGTRKAMITHSGELKVQPVSGGKPAVELMKERYWGTAGTHQALFDRRISLETRAMKEQFPQFELQRCENPYLVHGWTIAHAGELYWRGSLQTYSASVYQVAVVYPVDYPFGEIRAYVLYPYLPVTEHRFCDGRLCLYEHQGKGRKQ